MKKLLIILTIMFPMTIFAFNACPKMIKVAVIDTGFGYDGRGKEAKLCKNGHKDFTVPNSPDSVPLDVHSHGTNVVGLIEQSLNSVNYCIVIIKYHHISAGWKNLESTIKAFNYASEIKADYVNYSSGGEDSSAPEKIAVERYLNGGGTLITAAGNDGKELGKNGTYYPAMYDRRIIAVGNLNADMTRHTTSNYGKLVTRWEVGQNKTAYGITMSGTSQATAITTGKIILEFSKKCDIGKQ